MRSVGIKRLIDVVLALGGILATGPFLAAIALAILSTMGPPVIFRQARPGLHGKPFLLAKFRTMSDERGPDGRPLPGDQRLTPLGRWLRSWSLDELPQLFSVLRGDMSLVGPRPLLMDYLDLYSPSQARRHEVRPGITGLAQVSGRNLLDWEDRLALDVWYVDHWSLALDLKILLLTVKRVLKREGISARGRLAGGPRFRGSRTGGGASPAGRPGGCPDGPPWGPP